MFQCNLCPRQPGTPAQLKCRDYIQEQLKKSCDKVSLVEFTHVWSRTKENLHFWNVVGEQNWDNAAIRVVLTTHWDSRPEADQDPNPENKLKAIPGADDGASGTAVLLELARVLKVSPAKVGVMYVFVDGEDLGPGEDEMYLGSIVFANDLPKPKPNYGILLDMIGNKGVTVAKEPNSEQYAPALEDALYNFAATIGLGATFPNTMGEPIDDDHLPLNKAGLPTIDLIDFNYGPWHTLQDTPDKCSPDSLNKIGTLLQKWLRKSEPFKMPG